MDGHGSHVTLKVIKQAKNIGLDMITLPFHTSHALQPLDVSCFEPFKTTLKKVKDVTMSISNHQELDKITLVDRVGQALEQSLTEKTLSLGLKLQVYGLSTQKKWITRMDH
jgi:hypothetical protein